MKKRYILILILILTIGFASINVSLFLHGNLMFGKNSLTKSIVIYDTDIESIISSDEQEFSFTLNEANNYRINYSFLNKELQYDSLVNVECDGSSNITYGSDTLVRAQTKGQNYLTINKTDNNEEEITCRIVNVLLEKSEIETQKIYKLIFDPNTGNLSKESKYVVNGEIVGSLPVPTKRGYTFNGWYTESNERIDENDIFSGEANVFLKAQYTCDCLPEGTTWEFPQKDFGQEFKILCDATYKVELWGASGGNRAGVYGGYGGYTSGIINLNPSMPTMYVYVGAKGEDGQNAVNKTPSASYNGGGAGANTTRTLPVNNSPYTSGSGGGATDIRLTNGLWSETTSLISRIMVAGGGGGMAYTGSPGSGGGLSGTQAQNSNGGSGGALAPTSGGQTDSGKTASYDTAGNRVTMGTHGGFGYGGRGVEGIHPGGGAGGGYYGGGAGGTGAAGVGGSAGGGGSSFISGHLGCVAVTTESSSTPKTGCTQGANNYLCSVHPSNYVFTNTVMIDGTGISWNVNGNKSALMPNPSGGYYSSGRGHIGDGYARITLISY